MARIVSILVPCYNEEEVLPTFYDRVDKVLSEISYLAEIVFVNDGSKDKTLDVLIELRQNDPRITIVDLSRNFGKEVAMTAGFENSEGEAVVVIDADLQDPPELIHEFIKFWEEDFDVVYAQRKERADESLFKKVTAHAFYRFMAKITHVEIPKDTGDFRLMSRRAVDALLLLRERNRFMKGLFAWVGFPQKAVLYNRDPRFAGESKWNYWTLWNFAIEGITSFTELPLKISTYIGLIVAVYSLIYGVWIIIKTLVWGDPVAGYPTMMAVILFLGGVQLISIGIIGEYLGRTFREVKRRPLYLLNALHKSNIKKEGVKWTPKSRQVDKLLSTRRMPREGSVNRVKKTASEQPRVYNQTDR